LIRVLNLEFRVLNLEFRVLNLEFRVYSLEFYKIMINNYSFGQITIDNKTYNHDLILFDGKTIDWWRKEGHNVATTDLKDLPDDFDVLIIGSGASGVCKVPKKTIDYIKKKLGVELVIEMTGDAVKTYNRLADEGKKVAGAFHLTC
jgi:hypothetical protein